MRNPDVAGSLQGLHLMVTDVELACADLLARDVEVSEPFHFTDNGQTTGVHSDRVDFGSFASFKDPDGTGWLLQERGSP